MNGNFTIKVGNENIIYENYDLLLLEVKA